MALTLEKTNEIEATSDEAKDMLGRLDKTIDGIIGEFVKEKTDLHDFVSNFEGVDETNKEQFMEKIFGDFGVVGVMNRAFETLVYSNQTRLDENEGLQEENVSPETIKKLKSNLEALQKRFEKQEEEEKKKKEQENAKTN